LFLTSSSVAKQKATLSNKVLLFKINDNNAKTQILLSKALAKIASHLSTNFSGHLK
jgi:hypothetical protein